MHPKYIALSLALLPFGLLPLSSSYVHAAMEEDRAEYETHASEAWTELKSLDEQFLSMQRTRSLLEHGEEKIFSPSLAKSYLENFRGSSALQELASLQDHVRNLQEGIATLEARLASIGRKVIVIDLSEQRARLIERGNIHATFRVSSGARETPTPKGKFQVHQKQVLRVSSLDTPYRMPYYMAFTPNGSHGLHALPYLGQSPEASGFWQEARSHIGTPVSHGCVRFLPEDAATIFDWAEIGTKVYIQA